MSLLCSKKNNRLYGTGFRLYAELLSIETDTKELVNHGLEQAALGIVRASERCSLPR
jgi:hypothetical protein